MLTVGGNALSMKNAAMSSSSRPTEEHAVGQVDRASGPADLLVVGDRRAGSLVVDDEAEVGLVEAHAERDRRHEGLHLARDQRVLERLALLGREVGVVRPGVDPLPPQERGDALRVGDGQAVDDAAAGQLREATRPARPGARPGSRAGSRRAGASRATAARGRPGRRPRAARRRRPRPGRWRWPSSPGPARSGRASAGSPRSAGNRAGSRGPSRRCSAPRRRRGGRSSARCWAGRPWRTARWRGAPGR